MIDRIDRRILSILQEDCTIPVAEIGRRLPEFADRPALLLWGMQDFVFDHTCLREFRRALPRAEAREYAEAGHYVLEDARAEVLAEIQAFLGRHPQAG